MKEEVGAFPPIANEDVAPSPGAPSQGQRHSSSVPRKAGVVTATASATPEGKELKIHLANAWSRSKAPVSFAEVVGPWASPEAAASNFIAMLGLCDEGALVSTQEQPFAPIILTPGSSWG